MTVGADGVDDDNVDDENFLSLLHMAFGKTFAMFGGNINFEHAFKKRTSIANEVPLYLHNMSFVLILGTN